MSPDLLEYAIIFLFAVNEYRWNNSFSYLNYMRHNCQSHTLSVRINQWTPVYYLLFIEEIRNGVGFKLAASGIKKTSRRRRTSTN